MGNAVKNKDMNGYWRAGIDSRKTALLFVRDLWKVILAALAGAILGVLLYLGYHAVAVGPEYKAYSEFYLDFAIMENGAAYDYYNGYTWNDLMTTDIIADRTLANLGGKADIAKLEQVTRADIFSDIRLLTVTITDTDETLCREIQTATENALVSFGEDAKEFEKITLIKTVTPERMITDDRTPQAAMLGAIIGLILSIIILQFIYTLDDSVRVASDLAGTGLELKGIRTKNKNEALESRLNAVFAEDSGSEEELFHIDAAAFQNTEEELPKVPAGSSAVVDVPYGKVTTSALKLLADRLKASGTEPVGCIITDADEKFLKAYYSFVPKG